MLPKIQKVIDSDQCISCGACHHICPKNNISLEVDGHLKNFSINYKEGWNLLGPPFDTSFNILESDLSNVIVENTFYKFTNEYKLASIMESGKGYWLKLNKDKTINY